MSLPTVNGAGSPCSPLYSALVSLCWDEALWSDVAWWQSLGASATEFLELAWSEGLFPDVYERFRSLVQPVEEFEQRRTRYELHRSRLTSILPAIVDDVLLIKGLGIESVYPAGRRRYSSDTDVVVKDIETFCKVADILVAASYKLSSTMLLYRHPVSGAPVGVGFFDHTDALAGGMGMIEVQIGIFPLSYCTSVPFSQFALGAQRAHIGRTIAQIPSVSGQLLLLLAEFQTRNGLRIRDVYDWIRLCCSDTSMDVRHVADVAAQFGIGHGVAVLRDGLRTLCPADLRPLVDPFLEHHSVRKARILKNPDIQVCSLAHMWHHLTKVEGRRWPVVRALLLMARGTTMRWNKLDKHLALLRMMDAGRLGRALFEHSVFSYFVRLNDRAADWVWRRKGIYAVVGSPIGEFVATTNAVLTEEDIRRLREPS